MALDLSDYELKARDAAMAFWGNRQKALEAKIEAGTTDTGERGAVTAGNTMDGFTALMIDLVQANLPVILIAGGAFVVYQMWQTQKKRVEDHREGKNVGR